MFDSRFPISARAESWISDLHFPLAEGNPATELEAHDQEVCAAPERLARYLLRQAVNRKYCHRDDWLRVRRAYSAGNLTVQATVEPDYLNEPPDPKGAPQPTRAEVAFSLTFDNEDTVSVSAGLRGHPMTAIFFRRDNDGLYTPLSARYTAEGSYGAPLRQTEEDVDGGFYFEEISKATNPGDTAFALAMAAHQIYVCTRAAAGLLAASPPAETYDVHIHSGSIYL